MIYAFFLRRAGELLYEGLRLLASRAQKIDVVAKKKAVFGRPAKSTHKSKA